jgi:predicted NBD/HSP70 family sugar kinase/biotin operon repressor
MSGGTPGARGHNLEGVRRRNLSTVLRLVHTAGPVSRSALTQATGLNRSTVGALVGELEADGLIVESDPGRGGGVGRPSPVVSANPNVVALAVNPEIDAVTVGVVGLGGVVHRRVRFEVDHVPTADEAVQIVRTVLDGLQPALDAFDRVVGIGVAVPGLVRESDGLVRLAPHLEWVDEPFAAMLVDATGLDVSAANDAHLGANAERLFGAGREAVDLVYVNGGASGIGAGVVVDGTPLSGSHGYAGEFGHTLVNSSGSRCHCGARGCLETEVSQAALRRVLGIPRGELGELEKALSSDRSPEVARELERQVGFLAVALRNATNLFNPDRIVLGGFLGALASATGDRLSDLVAREALGASVESLTIVRAALGEDLLMVGAAQLAFESLLETPGARAPSPAG